MITADKKVENIDEYIDQFPEDVRSILERLRELVHEIAPEVRESISYGMPTFRLNGVLLHFAAFKHHIGLYPTPSAIEAFKDLLVGYELSKGTVRFPLDGPVPYDLIGNIIRFRVGEDAKLVKRKRG